jgi:isocitrate/isopropylmalate dehydrogenase
VIILSTNELQVSSKMCKIDVLSVRESTPQFFCGQEVNMVTINTSMQTTATTDTNTPRQTHHRDG